MTTVNDLIVATQRRMAGRTRLEFNELDGSLTDSATTVSFKQPLGGITPGAYITVADEIMYVWAVDTTNDTATVRRGMLGTEAVAHDDSALVEVNARFSRPWIREELRNEIASWPRSLFQVDHVDIEAADERAQGIDLPIGEEWWFILEIRQEPRAPTVYPGDWSRIRWFEVARGVPTDEFTSGIALIVNQASLGGDIRVVYGKPFDTSDMGDNVTTEQIGLTSTMEDIPSIGAAWRLLAPHESGRTEVERRGTSATSDHSPPGHAFSVADAFMQLRQQRIGEEAQRLLSQWPTRHT